MRLSDVLGFSQFYRTIQDQKTDFKFAYKVNKMAAKVDREINFFQRQMQEIIDEYGEKDADGKVVSLDNGGVKIAAGREAECQQRISELENVEVDLQPIFKAEELEKLTLSPRDLEAVMPFMIDEDADADGAGAKN